MSGLFVCLFVWVVLVLYCEDGMISLFFGKKGPMYPLLKKIIKEMLKCLPLVFREFREFIIMAGRQILEGQFSEKPL